MFNVTRHWYQKSGLSMLLWPLSLLYRGIIIIRKGLFTLGIKKVYRAPVPVIIVGNITVGGVGKTPLVVWLAAYLKQQGLQPGLVSRGYGGKATTWPQAVTTDSDPRLVGDEPVMLVRKTHCPMVVGPDRAAAVKQLLRDNNCTVVISDDGLQHYALGRDFEIAVLDGQRRLGNGFCLPAGPLREPASQLKKVDAVVINGEALSGEIAMTLVPSPIVAVNNPMQKWNRPHNITVHAVAGIGNPERFFTTLRELGFTVIPHSFPDHHVYTKADIDFGSNSLVIMTEKDAVKCMPFAGEQHWYLPVSVCAPALEAVVQQFLKARGNR